MQSKLLPVFSRRFGKTTGTYYNYSSLKYVNSAESGKENFEKDFGKCHIETSFFQKCLLGIGSGVISITSPSRGDMIAVLGEVTGPQALEYVLSKMMQSPEGSKILEDRPRISSGSVDLEKLKKYPEGTLGKAYSNFLERYGYTPDTRNSVRFVDDIELAYVAQRYREAHDLFHTLLNMPTNMLGEVTVKWVEAIQTRLPMCAAGALFGSVRLAPKFSRAYSTRCIVQLEPSLREKIEKKEILPKNHPGVMNMRPITLPEEIQKGIRDILKLQHLKHLIVHGRKLNNVINSRHLPVEWDHYKARESEVYAFIRDKFAKKSIELKEEEIENKVKRKLYSELYNWKRIKFDKSVCLQYMLTRGPIEYAALRRVFNEIVKRDANFSPKTLFDFGSGVGTVTWAAHEIWGKTLNEYYCVDSSSEMNDLANEVLKQSYGNSEPFLTNIYYRQFLPVTPTPYDIVVSSFSFFELPSCEDRLRVLTILWNKTTNYLVLIEVGTNAGYHVIAEARDYILQSSRKHKLECHVVAPCPHDLDCPRYYAKGKFTPCNFSVKYNNTLLNPKNSIVGKQRFSFVILKKGPAPSDSERPSRIVRDVLRRDGHVVCRLCTNQGKLEDLTTSASKCGVSAYKCLRFSNWGDLVPGTLKYIEKKKNVTELYSGSDSDSDSESSQSDSDQNEDNNKSEVEKKGEVKDEVEKKEKNEVDNEEKNDNKNKENT